jgi:hypothetical protein
MKSLLLIYPPLAKNCEPPPGIARLAGVLRANGVHCATVDANRLGLHYLLGLDCARTDTWSARAKKNLAANVTGLQQLHLYRNLDRYKRAVADINRVLVGVGETGRVELSLSNYQDKTSPVQSDALRKAAGEYKENLFYPLFRDSIRAVVDREHPDIVGISIAYLSQAVSAFALIGFLRAEFPGMKIVIGGGLVTSWLRSPLWKDPFKELVDSCIAGPGEQPLLGMAGQNGGEGTAAPPEYDTVDYLAPGFILPYAASSGCYWNRCLFCPETAEENPYVFVHPQQVLSDLQVLCCRYRPLLIHFLDNAISSALMKSLVESPPGVPWYGFARAGSLLADEEFCHSLRRSGCVMLKLGLESGDQQVLDSMHKGIKLGMVDRVLRSLKAAGILTYVYLLFGTPSEDENSARRTMEFTARHHEEIGFLNLAVFNLPLGGPETSELATNEFYKGDLSLYTDFIHPRGWSRRKIRAFLAGEFKRHPAIAPIILRDPPSFTSNHAPLFHPSFFTRHR